MVTQNGVILRTTVLGQHQQLAYFVALLHATTP